MPPEPKRPIEKLLEASGQARRAEFGPNLQMPNPMRARLQDEIARLNRTAEVSDGGGGWLAKFWPRLSIATALAAVLITGSVMWLGSQSKTGGGTMTVAMQPPAEGERDATAMLKSLDLPAQSRASSETASGGLADNHAAPPQVALAPSAPSQPPVAADATLMETKDARLALRADEVAKSAPAGAASSESFANASSAVAAKAKPASANQQQFSQTARGQALRGQSNRAANILDTFQVEQNGREIRVVDADGSTYVGKFEAAPRIAARRMLKQEPAAAAAAPSLETGQRKETAPATTSEMFFRATGYNSSLKKQVVFEGNYIPISGPEQKAAAKSTAPQQAPARIVGQAKVPGESPIDVDAASISR